MCIQQMLDYGLNQQSAAEMKARVLKHMTEMVLPLLMEPSDPSDNKSQENIRSFCYCIVARL